jgi:peroxiredoxin
VLISPQLVENNRVIAKEKKLSVPILSDPGNAVAGSYNISFSYPEDLNQLYRKFGIHLDQYNGDDSWTLPLPARFVIDREGIIRHADINVDYTIRPEPEDTLAALKKIVS